jgi:hypothetical protein
MITTLLVADDSYAKILDNRIQAVESQTGVQNQIVLIDATTAGLSKFKYPIVRANSLNDIGSTITSFCSHQLSTDFFAVCLPNCVFYRDKLSASIAKITMFDFASCVYTDYQKYQNGNLLDVFEHPFDVRLFMKNYRPNFNSLYRTAFVKQFGTLDAAKMLQSSILLHVATPLFSEQ